MVHFGSMEVRALEDEPVRFRSTGGEVLGQNAIRRVNYKTEKIKDVLPDLTLPAHWTWAIVLRRLG
jgi:hypothetical protein